MPQSTTMNSGFTATARSIRPVQPRSVSAIQPSWPQRNHNFGGVVKRRHTRLGRDRSPTARRNVRGHGRFRRHLLAPWHRECPRRLARIAYTSRLLRSISRIVPPCVGGGSKKRAHFDARCIRSLPLRVCRESILSAGRNAYRADWHGKCVTRLASDLHVCRSMSPQA
jgi:hypothetical protein